MNSLLRLWTGDGKQKNQECTGPAQRQDSDQTPPKECLAMAACSHCHDEPSDDEEDIDLEV
jgi:hypothetical protein